MRPWKLAETRGLKKLSVLSIIDKMEVLPVETTRVTASEFQQAFGALSDKARHVPVVITKHGRDSLVAPDSVIP